MARSFDSHGILRHDARSSSGGIQMKLFMRRLDSDRALEAKAEFFQQLARSVVVWRQDGNDPTEPQHLSSVRHDRSGGLERITAAPELWKQCEAQIDVFERVPLDESAHADELSIRLQFDRVETKTHSVIHRNRSILDITPCIVERLHAPVTDEADPGGLIQQVKNEFGIVDVEPA